MYKEAKPELEEEAEVPKSNANRRRHRHLYERKKTIDPALEHRTRPWIVDVPSKKTSYKGVLATPGTDNVKTAYVLFVKEAGRISVLPAADWYSFRVLPRLKSLSTEEAETKIRNQEKAEEKLNQRVMKGEGANFTDHPEEGEEPAERDIKEEVDYDDVRDDDDAQDVVHFYDDEPTKRFLTDEGKIIKGELRKEAEISPEELDILPEGEDIAKHVAGAKSKRKALAPPPVEIETKKMRSRSETRELNVDEESIAWVINRKGRVKMLKLISAFKDLIKDDASKNKFAAIVKRISTKENVMEGDTSVAYLELTEKYKKKYDVLF